MPYLGIGCLMAEHSSSELGEEGSVIGGRVEGQVKDHQEV